MNALTKASIAAIATAAFCIAGGQLAAQQYPPTTSQCVFDVQGEVGGEQLDGRAEYVGDITTEGGDGCAAPHSEVEVRVGPVSLGTLQAGEDGSFSETFTLPSSVEPGSHTVVAEMENRGEVSHPLEVIGATVLGTSETRGGGGDEGGILPRTGAGILLLVLWALALIALGSTLVVAARRWRQRAVLLRADGQLGADNVPFVDTSRFVPYLSLSDRDDGRGGDREKLHGWDAARKSKTQD